MNWAEQLQVWSITPQKRNDRDCWYHKQTTMTFDKYKETGGSAQKQTHVTFNNPRHPDVDVGEDEDEEKVQRWYEAAKSIQNSEIDRRAIVGDFLIAVDEENVEEFVKAHSE